MNAVIDTPTFNQHLSPLRVSHKSQNPDRTFTISFCKAINSLLVKGWSVKPEYRDQYSNLLEQIESHIKEKPLTVYLSFELFNASTAKFIFSLIKLFNHTHKLGKRVKIEWVVRSNNVEIQESGLDFKEFASFPFQVSFM